MYSSDASNSELLKSLLEPLLEDFQYWFGRSRQFLERETLSFLSAEQKADLLARVIAAQQEVGAAQMLFKATDGQVGIATSALAPWHRLVNECWQVSLRFYHENDKKIR